MSRVALGGRRGQMLLLLVLSQEREGEVATGDHGLLSEEAKLGIWCHMSRFSLLVLQEWLER